MWGGYKHNVIWRYYVLQAWCLLDLRQRDYGSLFWSFHVRRLQVNVEVLRILLYNNQQKINIFLEVRSLCK